MKGFLLLLPVIAANGTGNTKGEQLSNAFIVMTALAVGWTKAGKTDQIRKLRTG